MSATTMFQNENENVATECEPSQNTVLDDLSREQSASNVHGPSNPRSPAADPIGDSENDMAVDSATNPPLAEDSSVENTGSEDVVVEDDVLVPSVPESPDIDDDRISVSSSHSVSLPYSEPYLHKLRPAPTVVYRSRRSCVRCATEFKKTMFHCYVAEDSQTCLKCRHDSKGCSFVQDPSPLIEVPLTPEELAMLGLPVPLASISKSRIYDLEESDGPRRPRRFVRKDRRADEDDDPVSGDEDSPRRPTRHSQVAGTSSRVVARARALAGGSDSTERVIRQALTEFEVNQNEMHHLMGRMVRHYDRIVGIMDMLDSALEN